MKKENRLSDSEQKESVMQNNVKVSIPVEDSRPLICEQQLFELSEKDRITFMEVLTNPPKPEKHLLLQWQTMLE